MSLTTVLISALVLFIPTAWAIIHIAYRTFDTVTKKALWALFVVFVPPVGGIVYLVAYQIGKMNRKSTGH